jgi:hypothetical protein
VADVRGVDKLLAMGTGQLETVIFKFAVLIAAKGLKATDVSPEEGETKFQRRKRLERIGQQIRETKDTESGSTGLSAAPAEAGKRDRAQLSVDDYLGRQLKRAKNQMRWGFCLSRVERAAAAATRARNAHVLFPLYVTYSR